MGRTSSLHLGSSAAKTFAPTGVGETELVYVLDISLLQEVEIEILASTAISRPLNCQTVRKSFRMHTSANPTLFYRFYLLGS
jgi:hypothetical protein